MHKQSQKSTFLYYPHIINRFYYKTLYKSNVSFPGVTLDTVFLAGVKKNHFSLPRKLIQATMLNKWLSWSRFWVRKFSMIHRTLQNTWFGTKISRAFSLVCIWPFYLRFVVSDPLRPQSFPGDVTINPAVFGFNGTDSPGDKLSTFAEMHISVQKFGRYNRTEISSRLNIIFFSCMKLSVNAQT